MNEYYTFTELLNTIDRSVFDIHEEVYLEFRNSQPELVTLTIDALDDELELYV